MAERGLVAIKLRPLRRCGSIREVGTGSQRPGWSILGAVRMNLFLPFNGPGCLISDLRR